MSGGDDVTSRIVALEKQNGELKELVAQLKSELENTEKRLDEIEKAAAAGGGGGNKGDGKKKEKKEKKEKKGGDGAAAAPAGGAVSKERLKEIAAALKEGGKKAQDIAGMHDMGGMSFFAITLETCKGDWELITTAMEGANKVVDESADDRKGGAGELAKCFLSTDDSNHLCMYYHVPKKMQEVLTVDAWLDSMKQGIGGDVIERSEDGCFLKYQAPQDSAKELFPLKMRDQAINQSFAFLKSKKLMPEEDEDDYDMGAMYEDAGVEW